MRKDCQEEELSKVKEKAMVEIMEREKKIQELEEKLANTSFEFMPVKKMSMIPNFQDLTFENEFQEQNNRIYEMAQALETEKNLRNELMKDIDNKINDKVNEKIEETQQDFEITKKKILLNLQLSDEKLREVEEQLYNKTELLESFQQKYNNDVEFYKQKINELDGSEIRNELLKEFEKKSNKYEQTIINVIINWLYF